jgi:putative transposase
MNGEIIYSKEHPEFITVTCLDWQPLLEEDRYKKIITDSLDFLTKQQRILVYAFVIMSNHFHLIWQMLGDHKRDDVQRDFLKFTGQQILKNLRNENSAMLQEVIVDAKDRKRQVWERNSLGIPLWSDKVFDEKLEYTHYNPVKAGLCKYPEEYKYVMNEDNR